MVLRLLTIEDSAALAKFGGEAKAAEIFFQLPP